MGTLAGYGEVWYNPKSLANILSMAAVRRRFRITMDTSVDAAMIIHLPSGEKLRFAEGPSGLYYYNVNNKSALFESNLCFLNTVEMNETVKSKERLLQESSVVCCCILQKQNYKTSSPTIGSETIQSCRLMENEPSLSGAVLSQTLEPEPLVRDRPTSWHTFQ